MMTDKSQLSCNGSLPEHWGPNQTTRERAQPQPQTHPEFFVGPCRTVTYYSCADVKIVGSTPLSQFQYGDKPVPDFL